MSFEIFFFGSKLRMSKGSKKADKYKGDRYEVAKKGGGKGRVKGDE